MPKLFTLLMLGAASSLCLADLSEQRSSRDDATSQDPRFHALNYYLPAVWSGGIVESGHPDVAPQRILEPPPERGRFVAVADVSTFWSNNLGNTDTDKQDGWGVGGVLGVHWRKPIVRDVLVSAYAYQDAYLFDADDLDYESSELGVGLMKFSPDLGDLVLFGRYEFLYFRADDPLGDIHKRLHTLRVGAGKTLLRKGRATVYLGVDSSYDLDVSEGGLKRFQNSARVSFSYVLSERFQATAYYRLSFRDYLNSSRQDWHQNGGFVLSFGLTDWAELYASTLYSYNDSNEAGSDYEAFESGVAAGVTARF